MHISNKFWTIAGFIIGVLSLIFAGVSFYLNREKSTSLEIKRVSDIELTKPLNVEGLSSTYFYEDTIFVEHLWQSSFVITNTGEQTLYGKGFPSRNIREDVLKLHLSQNNSILAVKIIDTNTDIFLQCDSLLVFSQWRPKEFVEIRILSNGSSAPNIHINANDIQNSTITYTKYSPEEKVTKKRFVDKFPYSLYQAIWWVVIIFETILFLSLFVIGVKQSYQEKTKVCKITTIVLWIIVLFLMFAPVMWMF